MLEILKFLVGIALVINIVAFWLVITDKDVSYQRYKGEAIMALIVVTAFLLWVMIRFSN